MVATEAEQFPVRVDYSHVLISACQRFLATALVLEPSAFTDAVTRLTAEAPASESPAEALMAWLALKDAVARAAADRHKWFHQRIEDGSCGFRPRGLNAPATLDCHRVARILTDFAVDYTRDFDAAHCWPPAIKAAVLLRDSPERPWRVTDLARAVYVSPATLARSFSQIFGATVLQYHNRVRLRTVVEQVRASRASIEGILVECGYRSPKDCYRLFRRLTGLTLSDVRRLSDTEYAPLMETTLALPNAEHPTHGTGLRS